MARPPKAGLSYFPMDVGYFDDDRIFELLYLHGPKGHTVYSALLTMVYREGYFLEMPIQRLASMIMRTVGAHWFRDREEVVEIIRCCAQLGLIDSRLLAGGVVTSAAIQRRWAAVTARRSVRRDRYWLLDDPHGDEEEIIPAAETRIPAAETQIPAAETRVIAYDNPTKKTKENQTKGNETRVYEIKSDHIIPCAQEKSRELWEAPAEIVMDDETMDNIRREFEPIKTPTRQECLQLSRMCAQYGEQPLIDAIRRARKYKIHSVNYVDTILRNDRAAPSVPTLPASQPVCSPRPESSSGMYRSDTDRDEIERMLDEEWLSGE